MKTATHEPLQILVGLLLLALAASIVGLMFSSKTTFKEGIKTLLGGFFFGAIVAYIIHDWDATENTKRAVVALFAMFAKPIYNKLYNSVGKWIEKAGFKFILNNSNTPPDEVLENKKNDEP